MRFHFTLATALAFLCAASPALAQPTDTYVSGLLHTPIGGAVFGPVDGRRLPVNNLGSSGQDGVEVRLDSAFGGGADLDFQPFLSTPGASFGIVNKGWDGLIYGNHRVTSNGDGTGIFTFDYFDMGATGVEIKEVDANGTVIFSQDFPGPIVDFPLDNVIFVCPPGTLPTPGIWHGRLCNTCPWIDVFVWYCNGTMYTNLVVTPTLPVGGPDIPGIGSMSITGSGIPGMVVSNANLRTYGVQCWGLDPAQVAEQCDDPNGCTPDQRTLHADNLGSSGLDGVAIALPPNNGGVSVADHKPRCCRGHVIIMKLYDDASQEQRVMTTQTTDPTGTEELDADFSALGADGFVLTAYDAGGAVIGPPQGTAIFNGGPRPVIGNLCPPGSRAIWEYIPGTNPIWVFHGCLGIPMELIIPGAGTLTGVASFKIAALNPTSRFGDSVRCDVLSDDPEGLVIEDIVVKPGITGDLNCDGMVNFGDINPFVLALTGPAAYQSAFPGCRWLNADCNGDGVVNFADINPFVALLAGH